jgi:hypothetical protein
MAGMLHGLGESSRHWVSVSKYSAHALICSHHRQMHVWCIHTSDKRRTTITIGARFWGGTLCGHARC